jgi:hypothetical protein
VHLQDTAQNKHLGNKTLSDRQEEEEIKTIKFAYKLRYIQWKIRKSKRKAM